MIINLTVLIGDRFRGDLWENPTRYAPLIPQQIAVVGLGDSLMSRGVGRDVNYPHSRAHIRGTDCPPNLTQF